MPPHAGQHCAERIRQNIGRIARRAPNPMWTDDFEQNRPERQVAEDFGYGGREIVRAETQPALRHEQRRQRARDEQSVVEPEPKQSEVRVWFDAPAVQRVECAAAHAERIERIAEALHSNARMPKPNAAPNSSLKVMISIGWR